MRLRSLNVWRMRSHSLNVWRISCGIRAHSSHMGETNVIEVNFSCVMKPHLSHVDVQSEKVQNCNVFATESHLSLI